MTTPPISIHKFTTPIQINLKEQLQSMALDMVDVTNGNEVLLEHLMANFHCAQGNQTKVVVELHNGLHNPIGPNHVLLLIKV
jgi:hypothetical protein